MHDPDGGGLMKRVGVAVVVVPGLRAEAGQATAQEPTARVFYDGNKLLQVCERDGRQCVGYVAGVAGALTTTTDIGQQFRGLRACIPVGVNSAQALDVVVLSLRAHPETRHIDAAYLV